MWMAFVESNSSGTGRLFVAVAARMGLRPIVLAANPLRYDYVAAGEAEHRAVDTSSVDQVRACLRELQAGEGLAGVWSSSEYFVQDAADLAARLGLPGADAAAIGECRNKARQRAILAKAGLPVPAVRHVVSVEEAREAARALPLPLVVKPVFGSGSVGVSLCDTPAQVAARAGDLLRVRTNERGLPRAAEALIEQFVDGPEYSVELFGREVVGITRKHVSPKPYFVETGHDFPARLPLAAERAIGDVAREAVEALGVAWGPTHVELRMSAHGPVFMEVNPRLAGGYIPELVRLSTGVDLIAQTLALVTRRPVDLRRTQRRAASIRFVCAGGPGLIAAIDGVEAAAAMPGVVSARVQAAVGQMCRLHHDFRDRIGQVIATGAGADDAAGAASRAMEQIRVTVRRVRGQAAQAGSQRADGSRLDSSRTDNPRTDNPRTGSPLTDGPLTGSPLTGGARTGSPLTGSPRTGSPRTDGSRPNGPRTDHSRLDIPREEAPRADIPREEGSRAEAAPAEGLRGASTGRVRAPLTPAARAIVFRQLPADAVRQLEVMTEIDLAHVLMLAERQLLARDTAARLVRAILALRAEAFAPVLAQTGLRGLYLQYEHCLIEREGEAVGGALQTARSRNDLQATMAKMLLRRPVGDVSRALLGLQAALLRAARLHAHCVMPAYTHGQPAVPITFGHYLAGVATAVDRGIEQFAAAAARLESCPLGAGAGGGGAFPIDTAMTAAWLGFARPVTNSVDAVASRDHVLRLAAAAAELAVTASRVAGDLLHWGSAEFHLLSWPDDLVGSSSAMPQKRNPFLLEHVQGRAGLVIGAFGSAAAAMHNAPFSNAIAVSGEANRVAAGMLRDASETFVLLRLMIAGARPNEPAMLARAVEGATWATELANRLVRSGAQPFRAAHRLVGEALTEAEHEAAAIDAAAIARAVGVSGEAMDPAAIVRASAFGGGPAPEPLHADIARLESCWEAHAAAHRARGAQWRRAHDTLARAAAGAAAVAAPALPAAVSDLVIDEDAGTGIARDDAGDTTRGAAAGVAAGIRTDAPVVGA